MSKHLYLMVGYLIASGLLTGAPNAADALAYPLPMVASPERIDVEVGQQVTVALDRQLPEGTNVIAKIGDLTRDAVIVSMPERIELTVRIPAEALRGSERVSDCKLAFTTGLGTSQTELSGATILTVYPRGNPLAKSINDVPPERLAYIHPGEAFTVHGSGFLAPKNKIVFRLGSIDAATEAVAADGKSFTARFSDDAPLPQGEQVYSIRVWDDAECNSGGARVWIELPKQLDRSYATVLALIPILLVLLIFVGVAKILRRTRAYAEAPIAGVSNTNRSWLQILLVDPATNTYSLSRFQFLIWLTVLVFAYTFVFVARVQVARAYTFPAFEGTEMAFLISLGTLVGSMATANIVGPKGAGDIRPSFRDLILHGGVIALDRVQQLIWTIVAVGILLGIVYGNAARSESLPELPKELLTLMGASSLGYLAGKAARKAGPVITQVANEEADLLLNGLYLSTDARVFINGDRKLQSNVVVEKPSQDKPSEFADSLRVVGIGITFDELKSVTIINPDGQEAKWEPLRPPPSTPIVKPA